MVGNRGPMQGNMMGGVGMNQGMMNPMSVQGQMMGGGPQQMPGMNQMNPMNNQQINQGMGVNQMGGVMMNQMGGGVGVGQGMNVNQMGGPGMGPGLQQQQQQQQMGMNQMGQGGGGGPVNNIVPGQGGGMVGQQQQPIPGGGPNPGMSQGMNVNQMQQNNAVGGGGAQMNPNAANQMNLMNQMAMARKPQDMMMNSPGNMFASGGVRSVTPNQFLRENPSPSVPSPANMGNPQSQMIPSPAMQQSPSPGMINVNQRNMANVMHAVPSPGTSLNTPGQPGTIPSPMNAQEEQLYKEKYRQLVKYIDPLKRMTAKMMQEKNSEWRWENSLRAILLKNKILLSPSSQGPS